MGPCPRVRLGVLEPRNHDSVPRAPQVHAASWASAARTSQALLGVAARPQEACGGASPMYSRAEAVALMGAAVLLSTRLSIATTWHYLTPLMNACLSSLDACALSCRTPASPISSLPAAVVTRSSRPHTGHSVGELLRMGLGRGPFVLAAVRGPRFSLLARLRNFSDKRIHLAPGALGATRGMGLNTNM